MISVKRLLGSRIKIYIGIDSYTKNLHTYLCVRNTQNIFFSHPMSQTREIRPCTFFALSIFQFSKSLYVHVLYPVLVTVVHKVVFFTYIFMLI